MIQAQVARAGIKVNIVVMEYGPMMTAVTELKQEMFQLAWGWNSGDASTVFRQIFTSDANSTASGPGVRHLTILSKPVRPIPNARIA